MQAAPAGAVLEVLPLPRPRPLVRTLLAGDDLDRVTAGGSGFVVGSTLAPIVQRALKASVSLNPSQIVIERSLTVTPSAIIDLSATLGND